MHYISGQCGSRSAIALPTLRRACMGSVVYCVPRLVRCPFMTAGIAAIYTADASWSEEVLSWASEHLPKPQHVPVQRSASQPGCFSGCITCADQKLAILSSSCRGVAPCVGLSGQAELSCHNQQQQQLQLQPLDAQQALPAGLQPPQQLFRGLRVRMAVASGIADGVKLHKVTRRVEYNGTTMRRVQSVADAPEGGQVSFGCC
jgi:hypothetical protein